MIHMSEQDEPRENTTRVTREEVEEYEEKHGETHPAFDVDHRPERTPTTPEGCLWEGCDEDEATVVNVFFGEGECEKTRVCPDHRKATESRTGVSVEVLDE